MKISIFVPMYNHESYVEKCLTSICLSYSDEIYIVACDDASTDNTYSVAEKTLKRLKNIHHEKLDYSLLRNKKNQGICFSLNRCIELIKTEYCYLIASDDYLIEKSLDLAVDTIQSGNYDAIISDCRVVSMEGKLLFESAFFDYRNASEVALKSKYMKDELVMNWTVPGPSLLLRRSVYDRIGNYQIGLKAEDRDFYLRLLSQCNVIFSERKIACYRIHDQNISASERYKCNINQEMASVNVKHAKLYSGLSRAYLETYAFKLTSEEERIARRHREKLYKAFKRKLKLLSFLHLI
ncbi:glycosyltransferase family 2 protein [Brenneria rubrifaciens]|uniref:Glycosyltransferase family 2 protein n=1 Tax=Brenneria rubrifaciens TaxID=55213 RepID=A0A4P8QRM5_9GAMM|nr:glycosyltransferase family A protein [Brenneria rubrifaciens]QCR09782.1 glycosyltransferase family 2 protein [Brenneria rubrifaciens]